MAATHPTKEERLQHIIELMREPLGFKRGQTYRQLMELWGLSRDCVAKDCMEASRIVRREINNPDYVAVDVSVALLESLGRTREIAMNSEDETTRIRAEQTIERLGRSWAAIAGADAPIRHVVENVQATPERARELMRKAAGDVTPGGDTRKGEEELGDDAT